MKYFLTLFASLGILASGYSEAMEDVKPIEQLEQQNIIVKQQKPSYKTKYVRAGGILIPTDDSYKLAPNFTAGYLYRENKSGVDISANYSPLHKNNLDVHTYTLPKVTYVRFYDISAPTARNVHNLYYGVGGSIYGMEVKYKDKNATFEKDESYRNSFHGLAGNLNLGYNVRLGKKITNFYQFGVNMPAIPVSAKGKVFKPSMELNLGLGF